MSERIAGVRGRRGRVEEGKSSVRLKNRIIISFGVSYLDVE